MSASVALQTAIYEALVADVGVSAIVQGRIFDRMPSDGDYPCVTFGPSQSIQVDLNCIDAREESIQLDCWSQDQGRLRPVKELTDAVKHALHTATLDLGVHALARLSLEQMRVFPDPDRVTGHGIIIFEAEIEDRTP